MPYGDRDEFNLQEAFEFARATIQMLIAINGGAAAAIIAFYGQALASLQPAARASLANGLTMFACGVVLATLTLFAGYIIQMLWGGNNENVAQAQFAERAAPVITGIACLFAIGSLGCFVAGCCFARGAILG